MRSYHSRLGIACSWGVGIGEGGDFCEGHIDFRGALRHSAAMAKPALGRGLGALLGGTMSVPKPAAPEQPGESTAAFGERVIRVPLGRIRPSPFQPRKEFAPEALKELTDSIKAQGILQPLLVRERPDHYELIAGERRWRAAQALGLAEAPVIVRNADDTAALEIALIENLQ